MMRLIPPANAPDPLRQAVAAYLASSLPLIVYKGPIDGPDSRQVYVFDCPVHDLDDAERQLVRGKLFIVTQRTPGTKVRVHGAHLTDDNEVLPARPVAPPLAVSNVSAEHALETARRNEQERHAAKHR